MSKMTTARGSALKRPKPKSGRAPIARLHAEYQAVFATCPDDYETLKDQAVYLGKLSGHSFVLMAARLTKIRDRALFREGGYATFKEFVEAEMTMDRVSVYNYMGILEAFGEGPLLSQQEIEYSKLAPAIPILKSRAPGIPKAKIRKRFISKAKTSTRREMIETAREIKTRYGISTARSSATAEPREPVGDLASAISTFVKVLPAGPLSKDEKQQLRLLVKRLTAMIVRPGA